MLKIINIICALMMINACKVEPGDSANQNGTTQQPPPGSTTPPDDIFDGFEDVPAAKINLSNGVCSGTLIGPKIVLTARHCFDGGVSAKSVSVRKDDGTWTESIDVKSHGLSTGAPTMLADTAWIELKKSMAGATPIAIATNTNKIATGATLHTWGRVSNQWRPLKRLALNIDPGGFAAPLAAAAATWNIVTETGGGAEHGGDSGGPLIFKQDGKSLLVGVLIGSQGRALTLTEDSWAFALAEPFLPQLQTDTGFTPAKIDIK